MVYAMIDDAGADGIWTRTLKARLGMHDSVFKAAVKALESRGYVSQLKSVENVNKKMLIKANLRPSDRATGGPWYTDSDLDEAFIAELEMFIFDYITRRSSYRAKEDVSSADGSGGGRTTTPKKGVVLGGAGANGTAAEGATEAGTRGRKRTAAAISVDAAEREEVGGLVVPEKRTPRREIFLPLPAGYTAYPTVRDIAELIDKSGITNNTTLSEDDVQQLVDVLVYDGLIEPIKMDREPPRPLPKGAAAAAAARNGAGTEEPRRNKGKRIIGYRITRIAQQDPVPVTKRLQEWRESGLKDSVFQWPLADKPTNGFVEVPCGRCPVFELCEDGGPVNPSTCVYFQRWLGREEG
jgi:DNA-directed RNA polymerase III subunit RPC6